MLRISPFLMLKNVIRYMGMRKGQVYGKAQRFNFLRKEKKNQ